MTSTAAVEMTANGSSGDTSGAGGTLARRYSAAKGSKPGPPASPNWYQCATAGFASGQPATTGSVAASTTDRKSTRLNSSHTVISYAVFCLKKKKKIQRILNIKRYNT